MKIETRDAKGQVNGWLCPIWNVLDGPQVDQVYLTVILAGMMKGPHLHLRRRGLFKCIKGSVLLVIRDHEQDYTVHSLGVERVAVEVHPGNAAALYNNGLGDAYVLNMPSPSWRPDDVDEHEVEGWDFKL